MVQEDNHPRQKLYILVEMLPLDQTATEEWSFPPPTAAATLTEGDVFLSGGIELKGFGKAAGIPAATWASAGGV